MEDNKKVIIGTPPNPVYQSEEFLKKLEEYYDTYGTFELTAKRLNEEFGTEIIKDTVSKIYQKQMALTSVDDKKVNKFFQNSFIRMQKRWEDSWEMIGDLVSEYRKMRKIIKERSQDDFTQALTFMKMSSQIIQITTEIRKQLEFISKQQEEIRVYQQNNLIISPIQIKKEINNHFKSMSKDDIQKFFNSLEDGRFSEFAKK